ncbi:MAG: 2-C-methyl-D-erythritol 2,4-cyclodiphosphate synthase [Caldisericaceae bacterium]|nr:2-C-methyl-D-erythritol 2,4-cyclodiphosphate synthase [Caldisericaceae bacterium]
MERIGIGFDSHRFAYGRKLILGGVEIPFEKGLLGHSDGDALVHSIIDAILGAAHLGNIGTLFPDKDEEFKDIYSIKLLEKVASLISENKIEIVNIDSVLIIEKPKISPFVERMEKTIANALRISQKRVSVKPKTNEGMGFTGKGEGVSAISVALVKLS